MNVQSLIPSPTIPTSTTIRILIPWDDENVRDALVTFAHAIGGEDAAISLLPIDASCHLGRPQCLALGGTVPAIPIPKMMPACADTIVEAAEKGGADVILLGTSCQPGGEVDCTCLPAQIALDSPIPVMLVRTSHSDDQVFPPILKRLLVPFDGSPRAAHVLHFAARLAGRLALPVHLVMVLDPKQLLPPAFAYDPEVEDMIDGFRSDAHFALKNCERILDREGVVCHSSLLYGPVVGCLEEMIESGDLVMMTTHGLGNAPHGRLGNVAARMIAEIANPMVIMRGIPPADFVVQGRFA